MPSLRLARPPQRTRHRHWGRSATVGSRCSAAKLVPRPQSRQGVAQRPMGSPGSSSLFLAACLRQGRVPGCAPGGAVTCLLRRQDKVTKEKATPLSVSPALRCGATCGARFRRGPRKLAWRLKQRAALIRLKLCSSARPEGKGSKQPFGPSLRSASASASAVHVAEAAQALGSDHDFAQRNSCSDPNPGMLTAARVLCHSCLRRRIQVPDDDRRLPARSSRWAHGEAFLQRTR